VIPVDLSGVPETLLWPLYARACASRSVDALFHDPKSVEVFNAIDYPFAERFGRPPQVLALRELCFDNEVRNFLRSHPAGTVVALADGLNTQSWRLDNGRARWLSVDLPEVIDLRRQLLPDDERRRSIACSALDKTWMDAVDPAHGVLIIAQGLLMYLQPHQVYELIDGCAQAFPGAALLFDAMSPLFTAKLAKVTILGTFFMSGRRGGNSGYQLPTMPWGATFEGTRKRLKNQRGIAGMRFVRLPRGRGLTFGYLAPLLELVPVLRSTTPWNAVIEFSPATTG
jgi:O-methyltransferase involved in polyketide biosynthesis